MRKSKFMLAAILLLAVGFAAVSTTLYLTGNISIGTNDADFDVRFTKAVLDSNDVSETVIIEDGKKITFEAKKLVTVGDISKLDFEVKNNSTMYDADVSIECTASGKKNEYYEIAKEVETPIVAQATGVGKIEVKLVKASIDDIREDFTCSLIGTAKERSSKAEIPIDPNKSLYRVLQTEAESGGVAKEYTGPHQDSFNGVGDKKIYHFYASDSSNATIVNNKNNVIFAGHCWQMVRTTDTGGVKMLYNGEVNDGKCLDTRDTHVGYSDSTIQNLNGNYYYGTEYNYDTSTKKLSLSGTLTQAIWNSDTYSSLIGKYTCKSTDKAGTCDSLYYVDRYYNSTSAYVVRLGTASHYSQFGTVKYNNFYNSPAAVGYMYNALYLNKTLMLSGRIEPVDFSYPSDYSCSYDYSSKQLSINVEPSTDNFFTLYPSEDGDYYLSYMLDSSEENDKLKIYVDSVLKEDVIGSNSSTVSLGKLTTASVIELEYIRGDSSQEFVYSSLQLSLEKDNRWFFGSDVKYENGIYTLINPVPLDPYTEITKLNDYRYTCMGSGEYGQTCSTVSYVHYANDDTVDYIELKNNKQVDDALAEMLTDDNVNTNNSGIKTVVDFWYERYLSNYTKYLEDTVFCNNRNIVDFGGWKPGEGNVNKNLLFKEESIKDLSCENLTDRFSTLNAKAKLKYPVGLMTNSELILLGDKKAVGRKTFYWSMSPASISEYNNSNMFHNDGIRSVVTASSYGVRPAISLAPDTYYSNGDGSMEHPYEVVLR